MSEVQEKTRKFQGIKGDIYEHIISNPNVKLDDLKKKFASPEKIQEAIVNEEMMFINALRMLVNGRHIKVTTSQPGIDFKDGDTFMANE